LAHVRDLLGHASIVTTERYDNQTLERLQISAAQLESGKAFDSSHGQSDARDEGADAPSHASRRTPKVGLRTTGPDEMWHIDTTVIRLLDGTRAYVHAVIDNFSRRILAWRVADTVAAINSVAVLLEKGALLRRLKALRRGGRVEQKNSAWSV
jgi:transposase InsO family protein